MSVNCLLSYLVIRRCEFFICPPMAFISSCVLVIVPDDFTETIYNTFNNLPSPSCVKGSLWSWAYGSWIYYCLGNQCLSPIILRVRFPVRRGVLNTLCDKVCQWLVTGWWFSPVSSSNKTDRDDITEILLKVALNTITLPVCNSEIE